MTWNVLFLDIDGVLNSQAYRDRTKHYGIGGLDVDAVARLNQIVAATSCTIVLSSTWRTFGILKVTEMLQAAGFTGEISDQTPAWRGGQERADEIRAWVNQNAPTRFVVLDDDPFAMPPISWHGLHVPINPMVGLSDRDVRVAISWFSS